MATAAPALFSTNGKGNGQGAIVSASRSILYAHREAKYAGEPDWKRCVERATVDMAKDIAGMIS